MSGIRVFAFAALTAFGLAAGCAKGAAQVNFYIGAPPVCPYGYYDYAPHNCAPDGYYGPEWFRDGVFIGAGDWFRGPSNFQGLVNSRLDPQFGYKGPLPKQGEKPGAQRSAAVPFHGNELRDPQGNIHKMQKEIASNKGTR